MQINGPASVLWGLLVYKVLQKSSASLERPLKSRLWGKSWAAEGDEGKLEGAQPVDATFFPQQPHRVIPTPLGDR